jgi:hypothetical protein
MRTAFYLSLTASLAVAGGLAQAICRERRCTFDFPGNEIRNVGSFDRLQWGGRDWSSLLNEVALTLLLPSYYL